MKRSKLFQKASLPRPVFHWHNKNHINLFAQDFARVIPHQWHDVSPNERFHLRDVDELLSSPFVGPLMSNVTLKSRYFAVPMRKAVPNYEEFKLSLPSDNLECMHTRIWDLFRGACSLSLPSAYITPHWQAIYRQNVGTDGLSNFIGVPWLMDQLCMIIFGKDLAYMEEFTAALLAAGGSLDANGNFTSFSDYFYASVLGAEFADVDLDYRTNLVFSTIAGSGTAPNYTYYGCNIAYATNAVWFACIDFPNMLSADNLTWDTLISHLVDDETYSFEEYLTHLVSTYVVDNADDDWSTISGPSDLDNVVKAGYVKFLSRPTRDNDNTDYFFGQKVRLDPLCAYQKIRYDWFTDLRFNNNVHDEFIRYYEDAHNLLSNNYVRWHDRFVFQSKLSGTPVTVNTLAWLLQQFVIDYSKDYFTTAALEPQAGPDLVIGPSGKLNLMFDVDSAGVTGVSAAAGSTSVSAGDSGNLQLVYDNDGTPVDIGSVWAQINESDEITPIKLRWQMALQKYVEGMNIGGYSRYTDFIFGQYGIRVPDPYLLRSIYLGGFRTNLNAEMVVARADGSNGEQTSQLGDLGGYGSGRGRSPRISGYVKEHVIVMGVNYVVPQTYYTQGLPSRLTDTKVLDFPMWQFKHVGEQPVKNREIFLGDKPSEIFGYQKRYSDKMFAFDEIHSEMLSTLRYMHTGRKFLSQPHLDQNLLSMQSTDGHADVLAVSPKEALPFWIRKFCYFMHKMCV